MAQGAKAIGATERERRAVKDLVKAHQKLDEKLTGAILLPKKRSGVRLLEVIPSMPLGPAADEPFEFLPTEAFRYGLRLYTGQEKDFLTAIEKNPEFAADVAEGEPIPKENSVTRKLQKRAKAVVRKNAPR